MHYTILIYFFLNSDKQRLACLVKKNFVDPLLFNFTSFEISQKKNSSAKEKAVRFSLFPKREANVKITSDDLKLHNKNRVLSIHSREQDSTDEGFRVEDKECWTKIVDLLGATKFRKEIKVQKSNLHHDLWTENEYSIGSLIVTPY